jgi:hypothetical protein
LGKKIEIVIWVFAVCIGFDEIGTGDFRDS